MDSEKIPAGKFGVNYGLTLGAIMIVIAIIMYATDMLLKGQQWPQFLYYVAFPVIIFYTITKYKQHNAGYLSLGEALKLGMVIAIISALVYAVYGLVFNYIIDPEFTERMIEVSEEAIANSDAPGEAKEMQLEWVKKLSNPIFGISIWIALSAFFGLIYSLIAGLVMKKTD